MSLSNLKCVLQKGVCEKVHCNVLLKITHLITSQKLINKLHKQCKTSGLAHKDNRYSKTYLDYYVISKKIVTISPIGAIWIFCHPSFFLSIYSIRRRRGEKWSALVFIFERLHDSIYIQLLRKYLSSVWRLFQVAHTPPSIGVGDTWFLACTKKKKRTRNLLFEKRFVISTCT